jgi:hypothetical protein
VKISWPVSEAITSEKDASWPGIADLVPVEVPEENGL